MPASPGANEFVAKVMRRTYLGSQRDYLLELEGGQQIRATTPQRMVAEVGGECGHSPAAGAMPRFALLTRQQEQQQETTKTGSRSNA